MKILIGADPSGLNLKNDIKAHVEKRGHEVVDIGMYNEEDFIAFYDIAANAAQKLQSKEVDRAILFCGTGMGVAIVANKFKGVYAGVIESEFTAEMCKVINNCNVLTMGGMIISSYKAKKAVDLWLEAAHTVGMEEYKEFLNKSLVHISEIENKTMI